MDAVWFYKTSGKQVPGEYSQLFEPVYLAGTAAPSSEIAARDMSIGDFSGFSYCSSSEHDNDHSWGRVSIPLIKTIMLRTTTTRYGLSALFNKLRYAEEVAREIIKSSALPLHRQPSQAG